MGKVSVGCKDTLRGCFLHWLCSEGKQTAVQLLGSSRCLCGMPLETKTLDSPTGCNFMSSVENFFMAIFLPVRNI